jgi:hypothetical protein
LFTIMRLTIRVEEYILLLEIIKKNLDKN